MNFHGVVAFISAFFCFVSAKLVMLSNSRSRTNKQFVYLSVAIGFWCLSTFMQNLVWEESPFISWGRLFYPGILFVPALVLDFAMELSGKVNRQVRLFTRLVTVIFVLLNFSLIFIENTFRYYHYTLKPGEFYYLFVIFFGFCLAYSAVLFVLAYRASPSYKKIQLSYIIYGAVPAAFIGFAVYFAQFYGIHLPMPHDIFVIGYIAIVLYALARYRLMDLRVAFSRTGIFIAVYGLVLGAPLALTTWGQYWLVGLLGVNWWFAPLIVMAIFATCGPFLYVRLLKSAESLFLRKERLYHENLKKAAIGITLIRNHQNLLDTLAPVFTMHVDIAGAAIYLFDPQKSAFVLKSDFHSPAGQPQIIDKDNPLVIWLGLNKEPLVYDETKREAQESNNPILDELAQQMSEINASVIVAGFSGDKTSVILALGAKHSGMPFSTEDLNNISLLIHEATPAIENSLAYERIEQQVNRRTSDLLEVQKQLIQAQKLATVGTLAGGVAHEINNPLTAILTSVQVLLTEANRFDADSQESLELIEEATKRCRQVVGKLMTYAKRPLINATTAEVDVLSVVESVVGLLGYQLKQENIKLQVQYKEGRPHPVIGNKNELEQVLTNLLLNSKDAIKEIKRSGTIKISLFGTNDWILLQIEDDGKGVPSDIAGKIFDPFFTTKDVGKGTGLGLAICQAIVSKHNGIITVESGLNPGQGAIFTIKLPKVKKEEEAFVV